MKCNECLEMIDQALELDLSSDLAQEFQEHLVACPDCRKQYEEMQWILESLGDMPMQPLPPNFKEELHEKLVEAQRSQAKKIGNPNWAQRYGKQFSVAAAVVIVLGVSTSMMPNLIGGNMKSADLAYGMRGESSQGSEVTNVAPVAPGMEAPLEDGAMNKSADMAVGAPVTLESAVAPVPVVVPEMQATVSPDALQERKVIQTGNIELEVKKYDEAVLAIKSMIQGSGGFIQDLSESYYLGRDGETQLKMGYITMRIPAVQFDSTYDFVKNLGKAVSQSANAQDITNQYRDTVNMKLNLEVREEQLRMIMAKAQRIEDIILVEGELSRVRGEINGLAGTLQQWDSLVDLATITLNMREVEDLTTEIKPIKQDLWTKAAEAFNASMNELKRNFENLIILLISLTPQLVISLLIIGIVVLVGRGIYKKIKKGRKMQ